MFTSQKFIDTRTGEIVIQVPVLDIGHFAKYHGSRDVGDYDSVPVVVNDPAACFGSGDSK
jgi:hypothetical protein